MLLLVFFSFWSHLFSLLSKFKAICMGTYFIEYIVSSSSHLSLLYYLSCIFLFWNEYACVPAHWDLNHHWIRIARWFRLLYDIPIQSLNATTGTKSSICVFLSRLALFSTCLCVCVCCMYIYVVSHSLNFLPPYSRLPCTVTVDPIRNRNTICLYMPLYFSINFSQVGNMVCELISCKISHEKRI